MRLTVTEAYLLDTLREGEINTRVLNVQLQPYMRLIADTTTRILSVQIYKPGRTCTWHIPLERVERFRVSGATPGDPFGETVPPPPVPIVQAKKRPGRPPKRQP